ncbi:hypothetical protein QFC21_004846 [Naganishia friedmannii]|uniref:Uncharacterized protein n=1 Tax=Naganishia friedmannii TaxID=89922 RepID=A0ACC2VCZ4_9TREE|nr:hypothetical protein QFC21_004846 [Naganishia friedmannii]
MTSGQTIPAASTPRPNNVPDRGQKRADFGPILQLYSNQGPSNLTANPRVFPLDPTECISFTIIVNQGTDQHSHEIKLNGNEAIEIYNSTSADKAEAKGCVFSMSRDGAEMDVHVATTDGIEGKQLLVLRIERNDTGCCVLSTIRRTNSHPTYKPSVKGASCEYEWKEIAQEAWEAGTWREDMSHDQAVHLSNF